MLRALVVDDQADIRLLIRMIIDAFNRGMAVSCEATDGADALAVIDGCDPDVVVLDHMMPGLSGIDTAKLIRERRPAQPMVLCSAYLDDAVRKDADEVGIGLCLSKTDVDRIPEAILAVMDGTRGVH